MRLSLLCLLLVGCATTPKPVPSNEGVQLRLAPASYGGELSLSQRITVTRGTEKHTFDAQLEVEPTAVRIAAVAMGQTFASMTWDGVNFTSKVSTHVPSAVTAERILSDVQLAWWPVDAIRKGLPEGWTLEQNNLERVLLHGTTIEARVTYDGEAPAFSHVHLAHEREGYALDIESVNAT